MSLKSLLEKTESIMELLEKARKIVENPQQKKEREDKEFEETRYKAPVPTYYPPAKPIPKPEEGGVHGDMLDFYTTRVHVAPLGNEKQPRAHASHSEHVVLYGGEPIALVNVHHAHPNDLGKPTGKLGGVHDHYVEIHAPNLDEGAHPIVRQKTKDYINSKHFKSMVDEYNLKEYGYKKPKWWLAQGEGKVKSNTGGEGAQSSSKPSDKKVS